MLLIIVLITEKRNIERRVKEAIANKQRGPASLSTDGRGSGPPAVIYWYLKLCNRPDSGKIWMSPLSVSRNFTWNAIYQFRNKG